MNNIVRAQALFMGLMGHGHHQGWMYPEAWTNGRNKLDNVPELAGSAGIKHFQLNPQGPVLNI